MSEEREVEEVEVEEVAGAEVVEAEVEEVEVAYTFRHYRIWADSSLLLHYQRGASRWFVQPRGGFTECYIHTSNDEHELIGYGFALCSRLDPYCYRTGRDISRGRARKMMRAGMNDYLWGRVNTVSLGVDADTPPFETVEEIHDYLESKLPDRFPFLATQL